MSYFKINFIKFSISFFLLFAFIISCKNKTKRPGEIIISSDDIEAYWYCEATVYSLASVVSITKGDSSIDVLKMNSNLPIADILIDKNTITIKALPKYVILHFRDEAFNYKVKLDTTITYEYWHKKIVEWDKQRD